MSASNEMHVNAMANVMNVLICDGFTLGGLLCKVWQ